MQIPKKITCICGLELNERRLQKHLLTRMHHERLHPRIKCNCGCTFKDDEQYKKHLKSEKHTVILSHGSIAQYNRLTALRSLMKHWQIELNNAMPESEWYQTACANLETVRSELANDFPEYI